MLPAIQTAKKVIAKINLRVPRSHGDGIIHVSQISSAIEVDMPIHPSYISEPTEIEKQIGRYMAGLIDDGAEHFGV